MSKVGNLVIYKLQVYQFFYLVNNQNNGEKYAK